MGIFWKKFFTCLLVFLVSALLTAFSIVISVGIVGLPEELIYLTTFISISLVTYFALRKTVNLLSPGSILMVILLAWLALYFPKAIKSSLNFTLTNIPFFITFLIAMASGYIHFKRSSLKLPLLMGVVPLVLTLWLGSIWSNIVVYGSADGSVQLIEAPEFSIVDKAGSLVSNESTEGKIVLLDFWFISCPPCWVKFPELQRVYDMYKTDDRIEIYAVNRPMKRDKPNELYASIEDKKYTFPVLKGSDELMKTFNIDYYPTVLIINKDGQIVFKGAIEQAETFIKSLIKQ
ncbi:MAG: TlpA family protein disulfide reductase [Cyclobacteriaceae bacterium]